MAFIHPKFLGLPKAFLWEMDSSFWIPSHFSYISPALNIVYNFQFHSLNEGELKQGQVFLNVCDSLQAFKIFSPTSISESIFRNFHLQNKLFQRPKLSFRGNNSCSWHACSVSSCKLFNYNSKHSWSGRQGAWRAAEGRDWQTTAVLWHPWIR